MRISSADGTRELRCWQVMDNLYGPSRQEACISCLHELLQTIFNAALFRIVYCIDCYNKQ